MRGQARDWGVPKTCTVLLNRVNGMSQSPLIAFLVEFRLTMRAIGVDFGTHHAASFSDGRIIDNPRFIKQSQEKVNRLAKKSRNKRSPNWKKRIRPSRRWKKANRAVSKVQAKGG